MTETAAPRKKRILVIDDYPSVLAALSFILTDAEFGYEVITAADGPTGIATAVREKPDLILLDFDMPAFNGLRVLQSLATESGIRKIPVIIMTGRGTREVRELSLAAGAREVVHKPFELPDLKALLTRYLPEQAA